MIIDGNCIVGYFPQNGELYVTLSSTLTHAQLMHALHSVRIGMWEVIRRANKRKFSIFEEEIKKYGSDYRKILKFLGTDENNDEKISFYVIPRKVYIKDPNQQLEIIEKMHKLPTGGHFGIEKMIRTLKLQYYWPNMIEQVKKIVKSCDICQLKKHANLSKSPMQITDTSSCTFERVFMDLVGPLPESHSNNKYILTIQDDLSKFLCCFPIKDKSANEVARALVEKFFLAYHFPKILVSDCGSEFLNKVQKSVCELLKIQHVTSAPYRHQTIGALENSHKSLNMYLRSFAKEDKYDWDIWLPYFSFAYNSTVHLSTKYAPFELIMGTNNALPDETLREFSEQFYTYDDFANEMRYRLKIQNKYNSNNNVKNINYQIGDYGPYSVLFGYSLSVIFITNSK